MENGKNLFDLNIDAEGRFHLEGAAKWGKFFAIIGFVSLAVMIIYVFVLASTPPVQAVSAREEEPPEIWYAVTVSVFLLLLYFVPYLFTLRFAKRIRKAVEGNNTLYLTAAFRNLKVTFRYLGITAVLILVFLLIGLLSELKIL